MQVPLITDRVTVDVLKRLYHSETKPETLTSTDMAVLTYLVLRRAEDHEINDSSQTIAERLCVERQTVLRSLERLQRVGWITVGGRGKGNSKALSVCWDAMPATQPIRDKITPEARELVKLYFVALEKTGRKNFPKGWLLRQAPSAQRILTHCGGDFALARAVMSFAFNHSEYKARARMSLYHLLVIWRKVTKAYAERGRASIAPPVETTATKEGGNIEQRAKAT